MASRLSNRVEDPGELRRMIVEWRARYRWRKNFDEPLIIAGRAGPKIVRRPAVSLQIVRGRARLRHRGHLGMWDPWRWSS